MENSKEVNWIQSLSLELRTVILESMGRHLDKIEEIRLRLDRPLLLRLGDTEVTVSKDKKATFNLKNGIIVTSKELEKSIEILSQSSLYAWEDELKNGYLTIPGGHRVGVVGRVVLENGLIKTLKEISGLNYRFGREVIGCADKIMPYVINKDKIYHTLIISPPQCGKTTLLRDIIRQLSDGVESLRFCGVNVGLVDERSEIAGAFQGQPQFSIGIRTDVLDACPKAQGMIMLIRAMSPRIVATDEIGKPEDIDALNQTLQAGVSVLTTVHGNSFEEIEQQQVLNELLSSKFFERLIILSRRQGVGTLEAVYDGKSFERLC
ncbi:MAG: stage III sporulation protein AA [Firmicutes bacterium HGW-Firmicutes-12]|nr:MAG: stage III sporulation protein AA [Firmicutes bacterium HGW-Firmicutes-12]